MINFGSKRLIYFIQLTTFVILGLSILLYILYFYRKTPEYYAYNLTTEQSKVISPLDRPNVSTQALLSWSTLAATSAYNLNFLTIQQDPSLQNLIPYFTNNGFKNFYNSIKNNLDTIIEKKLEQTAVTTNLPVILFEGINLGLYTWRIQVPILITYQGASGIPERNRRTLELTVIRVPTTEAPRGIGIAQIIERAAN